MIITFISDTHNKHLYLTKDLPGGDLLIHAGDISSMGYKHEIQKFCDWFNEIDNYDCNVFIAGNHDWGFQKRPEETMSIINSYKWINYLQDSSMTFYSKNMKSCNLYGTPWQPEFYNWAFNLPRNSEELQSKWNAIPEDTDILITHGPAWGILDGVIDKRGIHLGCELLAERIQKIKPKIHVCGHIHTGRGIYEKDGTLYINASVLNEQYQYTYNPITIDYDFETGKYEIIF